jgi:hypothetical protein
MSVGSARRRKLEAALEKAKTNLELTRAERDLLASTLHDVRERNAATPDVEPAGDDVPLTPPPNAERLAARVSELRELLTVLAPQTEEEQRRAREAVGQIRGATERVQALERQLEAARQREDRLSEQAVRDRASMADLEARILEFENIEARIARFEQERRAVEANAAELEHFRLRIEDLESQLQAEAERAAERESELAAGQTRIAELEAARDAAELSLADLTEAHDLAEAQRETALVSLEERLNDLNRLRTHVAEARTTSESAERERTEMATLLEEAESERDAARAALEARVGDVHRLRDKVAELEAHLGVSGEYDPGYLGRDEVVTPQDEGPLIVVPGDSLEVRIARVQERLEQTELRVRRALTTADAGTPAIGLENDPDEIVDVTGRDAQRELEKLREDVNLLAERAAAEEEGRRRAEAELAALRDAQRVSPEPPAAPEDPLPPRSF